LYIAIISNLGYTEWVKNPYAPVRNRAYVRVEFTVNVQYIGCN